jgi:hypothetical protein
MLALLSRVGRAAVGGPFRWYHRRLAEHPLAVKTVTTGGVLSTADFLSQWLRSPLAQDGGATPNSSPRGSACDVGVSPSKTLGWWNAQQTMWMGVYGISFVAPFCHVWYQVLPL